jgi:hypothetical protein
MDNAKETNSTILKYKREKRAIKRTSGSDSHMPKEDHRVQLKPLPQKTKWLRQMILDRAQLLKAASILCRQPF